MRVPPLTRIILTVTVTIISNGVLRNTLIISVQLSNRNLSQAYSKKERFATSSTLCREGLLIMEQYYSKYTAQYGDLAYNLAVAYKKSGDFDSAVQWFADAIAAYVESYGFNHPRTNYVRKVRADVIGNNRWYRFAKYQNHELKDAVENTVVNKKVASKDEDASPWYLFGSLTASCEGRR